MEGARCAQPEFAVAKSPCELSHDLCSKHNPTPLPPDVQSALESHADTWYIEAVEWML